MFLASVARVTRTLARLHRTYDAWDCPLRDARPLGQWGGLPRAVSTIVLVGLCRKFSAPRARHVAWLLGAPIFILALGGCGGCAIKALVSLSACRVLVCWESAGLSRRRPAHGPSTAPHATSGTTPFVPPSAAHALPFPSSHARPLTPVVVVVAVSSTVPCHPDGGC